MTYTKSPLWKVTLDVSAKIMERVTQVVHRDVLSDKFSIVFETRIPYHGKSLGSLDAIINVEGIDKTYSERHSFDLQMMLDLKDGWIDVTEHIALRLMSTAANKAGLKSV